jgi:hypothetical protein
MAYTRTARAIWTPELSESDIERTCTDWLVLDGWRSLKTDPVSDHSRAKGFGELGMADRLYLRYLSRLGNVEHGSAQVLWIEWKRKGGKAREHQKSWIVVERSRGALVLLAGEDFPASIEGFQEWYRSSWLMRRNLR